jgi:hypothetical protein
VGYCEPNSPPVGAKLVIIGGDQFVDSVCEYTIGSQQIITSIGDVECNRVYLRISKVAVTFSGMKAFNINNICHELW